MSQQSFPLKSPFDSSVKVNIGGVEIDRITFAETVDRVIQQAKSGAVPRYVVTPNAHHINLLQRDDRFRNVYRNAFLVVADGVSLLWAAQWLNRPLHDRVNGTDLFEQLCAVAADKGLKVFLLGGRPGAAQQAAQRLVKRHPTLCISGTHCPPYGFEQDPQALEQIDRAITAAQPDLLFVGLGAPKQEFWMYENCQRLGVPVSLGIGVSFELVAGMVQRAPRLMQITGLEWLFRLLVEPRRLWQRYLIGNLTFLKLVLQQKLALQRSSWS